MTIAVHLKLSQYELVARVQVDIPKGFYSERFLYRTVFVPKGFYSERFLLRKFGIKTIRRNNRSDL